MLYWLCCNFASTPRTLTTSIYAPLGEIALINHEPRKATVTASADENLLCLRLGRDKFERLLGPCEELLRRHIGDYHPFEGAAAVAKHA